MATAVASGVTSASLSAAGTLQFADRFDFVQVTNTGTTAIYASADPTVTAPSATTAATVYVAPNGGTAMLANRNPIWYQSSNVIQKGALAYGTGGGQTTTTPNGQPGFVTPMESLAGQMANPGTTVSISAPSASSPVLVDAAG